MENIAYTLKEINAVGGKSLYNAVALCLPSEMNSVESTWREAFDNTEYMFIANKGCTKTG